MSNLTPAQIQNAKNLSCDKCNNETFTQIFVIKKISGLMTQTGKDMLAPIPVFSCKKCGNVNKLFVEDLGIKEADKEQTLQHVQV